MTGRTDPRARARRALASFVSEERRGSPGTALATSLQAATDDPDRAGDHLADAAIAALLGGEPRRAVALLDRAADVAQVPPRMDRLVRAWAWQFDQNRYPGDTGAELTSTDVPTIGDPGTGPDEISLLEHVVTAGPPALSTVRTLVEGFVRGGSTELAGQVAEPALASLEGLAPRLASGPSGTGLWAHLAQADLLLRLGDPRAGDLLTAVLGGATAQRLPSTIALSHLMTGDQLLTPGSSPDVLGHTLETQSRPPPPRPAAEPARAAAAYDAAEAALGDLDEPRLRAALALRRAMLLGHADEDDHTARRRLLREAMDRYRSAGDLMGHHLAAAHLFLADLDAGDVGRHALDLGSGWHPPVAGPVADALAWGKEHGSTSWCVGLGRLHERAAQEWEAGGDVTRARLAYLAALPLLALNPRLSSRTIITNLADLDARSNLAARALVRLERLALATRGDEDRDAMDVGERITAINVALGAHRARARGAAAEYSALAMQRLREELAGYATRGVGPVDPAQVMAMLSQATGQADDLAGLLDESGQMEALFAQAMATFAHQLLPQLDVLVPLARADHARTTGRLGDAGQWYDEAVAQARSPDADGYLLPLALISADRLPEARAALRAAGLPDEFVLPLALRAEDHQLARSAADRLAATERTPDWQGLLSHAELLRAEERHEEALATAREAVAAFERTVAPLVRDPDRLAACDQPDVAALYLMVAWLAHRGGDDLAALTAAERGRLVSWGRLLDQDPDSADWRRWQRAAAEWSVVADRTLVQVDRTPDGLTDTLVAELDRADHSLAVAEHVLDTAAPGVLLRRSTIPDPGMEALVERLDADTLVLQYAAIGTDLIAWAVTSQGVRAVTQVHPYRALTAAVRTFHRECAGGRSTGDGELADRLVVPFRDELATRSRLVVVPFGALNLVPFHALHLDGQPLALSHVVSTAPLGSSLGRNRPLDTAPTLTHPLVVGDPAFDEDAHAGLRRLGGAEVEARRAATQLGAAPDRLLLGEAAVEADVLPRLATADVVHLATHGVLDELAPFASSLVLAGADQLTVADLAGSEVTTTLAVLTGCDTGRGTATLGGDVVGLTRALLRGGVRECVVSLWPVDDAVAPVVVDAFYRHLTAGRPTAHALALAQRELHGMSADDLRDAYVALGGSPEAGNRSRRRGGTDLDLDPELRDDEPLPEALDGSAERFWAPFVVVGS